MGKNILIALVVVLFLAMIAFLTVPQLPNLLPNQSTTLTSVRDALAKSGSFACNFTDEYSRQVKVSIKNGSARAEYTGKNPEDAETDLLTKTNLYVWRNNDKKGYVVELPTGSVQRKAGDALSQRDDFIILLEKHKDTCKPAIVADSVFTLPTDVVFKKFSNQ